MQIEEGLGIAASRLLVASGDVFVEIVVVFGDARSDRSSKDFDAIRDERAAADVPRMGAARNFGVSVAEFKKATVGIENGGELTINRWLAVADNLLLWIGAAFEFKRPFNPCF